MTGAGYLLQCAHYLALSGLPFCLVACLELRTLERDAGLLGLREEGGRAFRRHAEADEPPRPDRRPATGEALRALLPSARADSTHSRPDSGARERLRAPTTLGAA